MYFILRSIIFGLISMIIWENTGNILVTLIISGLSIILAVISNIEGYNERKNITKNEEFSSK